MDSLTCLVDLVAERVVFYKIIKDIFTKTVKRKNKYLKTLKSSASEELKKERIEEIEKDFSAIIDEIGENKNVVNQLIQQFEEKIEVIRVHSILNKAEHYKILMEL